MRSEEVFKSIWRGLPRPSAKTLSRLPVVPPPDLGISYRAAPSTIQKHLDAVEHLKRKFGMVTYGPKRLGAVLDGVVEFGVTAGFMRLNKFLRRPTTLAAAFALGGGGTLGSKLLKKKDKEEELSTLLTRIIEFQDPRHRNRFGQFSPTDPNVPDPNAMATTYRQPPSPQQQGIGSDIMKATLAAPLVGAGGTAGGMAVKALAKKLKEGKLKPRIHV